MKVQLHVACGIGPVIEAARIEAIAMARAEQPGEFVTGPVAGGHWGFAVHCAQRRDGGVCGAFLSWHGASPFSTSQLLYDALCHWADTCVYWHYLSTVGNHHVLLFRHQELDHLTSCWSHRSFSMPTSSVVVW